MPRQRKTDAVGISAKYREWLELKDSETDTLLALLSFQEQHLDKHTRKIVNSIRRLNRRWDKLNTDDLTSEMKGQS